MALDPANELRAAGTFWLGGEERKGGDLQCKSEARNPKHETNSKSKFSNNK